MNRAELIRRLAAHEAAAVALRGALETEARGELEENGTAPSWTLRDGSKVVVRTSSGSVVVTDDEAFIEWARTRFPGELIERVTVTFRNEAFRKKVLAQIGEECQANGWPLPPFLDRLPAGVYRSTSITIAPATKERMAASAREYVLAGQAMPELEA